MKLEFASRAAYVSPRAPADMVLYNAMGGGGDDFLRQVFPNEIGCKWFDPNYRGHLTKHRPSANYIRIRRPPREIDGFSISLSSPRRSAAKRTAKVATAGGSAAVQGSRLAVMGARAERSDRVGDPAGRIGDVMETMEMLEDGYYAVTETRSSKSPQP